MARPHELLELCLHASREGQRPGHYLGASRDRARAWAERTGGRSRLRKCGFCMTPCVHPVSEDVQAEDGTGVASVARHCWGYAGTSPGVDPVARAITSDYGLNGWEITYGMIPWLQLCRQHGLIDAIRPSRGFGVEIPILLLPAGFEYVQTWRITCRHGRRSSRDFLRIAGTVFRRLRPGAPSSARCLRR